MPALQAWRTLPACGLTKLPASCPGLSAQVIYEFANEICQAAAVGFVQVAEGAYSADWFGRCIDFARTDCHSGNFTGWRPAVRLLLAARFHVLPEHLLG